MNADTMLSTSTNSSVPHLHRKTLRSSPAIQENTTPPSMYTSHCFHGCAYLGTLEEFLVVPVEFKGLLEVEVGGGQWDGEVDTAHVGEDGVLWQGLQCHTRVLPQRVKVYTLTLLQVFGSEERSDLRYRATCVEEKPPKAFLCWESHLTTGKADATSPRRV